MEFVDGWGLWVAVGLRRTSWGASQTRWGYSFMLGGMTHPRNWSWGWVGNREPLWSST